MTDAELAAFRRQRAIDNDFTGAAVAHGVGKVRGIGEAFGVPLDPLAVGVGDVLGKRQETKDWLSRQKEEHPLSSMSGDILGQAAGFATMGEVMGPSGAPRAASALGRIGQSAASGAARGGLENLVAGTTSDINEASLGDHALNAQKILAAAPGHILWGAGPGAVIGGMGGLIGEAASGVARRAPEALDAGANSLVGREVGLGAAEGARIRGEMGRVPKDAGDIASFFGQKQAAFRAEANAGVEGAADMTARHAAEQSWLHATQTADRAKGVSILEDLIQNVRDTQSSTRATIVAERAEALKNAEGLAKHVEANATQLKGLSANLDQVKGRDPVRLSALSDAIHQAVQADPMGGGGISEVAKWWKGVRAAFPDGEVSFVKTEALIGHLDSLASGTRNPPAKQAFSTIRDAAQAEFDRASEATATAAGEGVSLNSARLRATQADLGSAQESALADVAQHDKRLADFQKQSVKEMSEASRFAKEATSDFDRTAKLDTKAQKSGQREQANAVKGAPEAKTPFDEIAAAAKTKAEAAPSGPASYITPGAAFYALLSLAHGNIASAALAAGGSLASGLARGKGNLMGAKVLAGLADHLRSVDEAIGRGARGAVGAAARETALAVSRANPVEDKTPRLSFNRVSEAVRNNQANPAALESRVRASMGGLAQLAPNTYTSMLESAQRAQDFLNSVLPPERRDPYSPTAHLESGDVSAAEKYDFMLYVQAINDPTGIMSKTRSGDVSDREVLAVARVYPGIMDQIRQEVMANVASLQRPIDYERSVHIGTLLGVPTSVIMEPAFQQAQRQMFADRTKAEKIQSPGSAPKGPNAKMSKASMSGSEKVESGEGY